MPSIGIVDDREEQRTTFARLMSIELRSHTGWSVDSIAPFHEMSSYSSWIAGNNISVLVLDERLHESAVNGDLSVNYNGHSVVDVIRNSFSNIPIWVISAYEVDDDLKERFPKVEDVLSRRKFTDEYKTYVSRFVRAGGTFFEENQALLEKIAEISRKVAFGTATNEEVHELTVIQTGYLLQFDPLISNSEWVNRFETTVKSLEDLEARVRRHIEGEDNALDQN